MEREKRRGRRVEKRETQKETERGAKREKGIGRKGEGGGRERYHTIVLVLVRVTDDVLWLPTRHL